MVSILLVNFKLLGLDIFCSWTLVTSCCCMNIILTCFLPIIAQPWRHDRLSPTNWFPSEVAKMLEEKFRPLNEILGNQTETQLWALKMTPIGFRCDDKPIQVRRKQELHLTKTTTRPNKKYITILNWYISGPVLIVQGKTNSPVVSVRLYLSPKGKLSNSRGGITWSNYQ